MISKNLKMKQFIILIFILTLVFIGCGRKRDGWKGTIETTDGVTLVSNPADPMFGPEIIQFENILTIGEEEGDEERVFWGWPIVRTDENLNIYIADALAGRLSKFDAEGNHLWSTGQKGQGPGEFEAVWDMAVDIQNHEILVLDNIHIDFYSLDGNYLRTVKLNRRALAMDLFSTHELLILPVVSDQTGVLPLIYNRRGQFLKKFAPVYSFGPDGLGPGAFSTGNAYQVFNKRIIFSLPDICEIREYNREGDLQRIITKDQKLNTFTIKKKNAARSTITIRDWSGPCFMWGDGYLINRVMIHLNNSAARDWLLDFYDPEGRFLCSYPLKRILKLDHIDNEGHLYFAQRLPFPQVIKSRLDINIESD